MSHKKGLGKLERFELEIPPTLEFVTRSLHRKAISGNKDRLPCVIIAFRHASTLKQGKSVFHHFFFETV